ncbi:hypothetical protein [Ornithinibacillus halophilus]|uniref:Uncharacterized protein n=1 Tax=Ornithinibacillus halophilus TaxID=930117 RepID=A0A1M5I2P5_9BACI|nr:hypothetical protein [Ornithinibacillus halophilus]SHG22535.1 hypothetical protein SAMN05216225_102122 [Ornithinibacillus halophilus]
MPRVFIHFTFFFFIITALSGVWMRYFPFNSNTSIPYENVLHGHSHLALLGWTFLGAFVIFLSINWKKIRAKKQAIVIVVSLFITSLVMFIAFFYQGYAVFSIVMSTLHIFVEYWTAVFIYKQLKTQNDYNLHSLYIKGALVVLIISSIGPYALGFISANGLKEHAIFDMAIYFYLHFQYNGWLYLLLVGTFLMILHYKNITISQPLLKISFWIYFISLFPGYFTNVQWANIGPTGEVLAAFGSIGQWIAVVLLLYAVKGLWREVTQYFSNTTKAMLWITLFLLIIKSTMELGLIIPSLATLVYETRTVIIGYLHLTLLGFISMFILTQYLMTNLLKNSMMSKVGLIVFFIGFMLNEMLLFIQTLLDWLNLAMIPYYFHLLLIASGILLLSIVVLWVSYSEKND